MNYLIISLKEQTTCQNGPSNVPIGNSTHKKLNTKIGKDTHKNFTHEHD